MERNSDHHDFSVQLYGQDLTRPAKEDGHFIARHHHFQTLKDAILHLLNIDVACLDEYDAGESSSRLYFHDANLVYGPGQKPVMDIYRVHFSDAMDGIPYPGIYLRLQEDPQLIQDVSGIDLNELCIDYAGVPFILLARIRFDQQYEMIVDPAFKDFQERLRNGVMAQTYGPPDWHYAVHTSILHFNDELTARLSSLHRNGVLLSQDSYHYHNLRDGFYKLLLFEHYALDRQISTDRGLGYHMDKLYLTDHQDQLMLSLLFIGEIRAENRLTENGVHLSFVIPLPDFERIAHIDLSGLESYPHRQTYHQILALTADRQRLICKEGFRPVMLEAAKTSPKNMAHINEYLEQAPFLLRIEWDRMPTPPGKDNIVPPVEIRPFVSPYQALVSLKGISEDLFYVDRPTVPEQGIYIRHAGIYDGKDGHPIWTKFLSEPTDPNLPKGVMTRLHDEKVSFDTLSMTLQLFSNMVGNEGLQFIVCKPTTRTHGTTTGKKQEAGPTAEKNSPKDLRCSTRKAGNYLEQELNM